MDRKIIQILILLLGLASCVKDKPNPSHALPPAGIKDKVLITCEGSFGNGNSALSLYRPDVDSIYEDVFLAANGQTTGDVLQSINLIGENYFLAVNNSDKIIVINRNDFTIQGLIPVIKPRYILAVDGNTAFVSSLFSNKIFIIDTKNFQLKDSVTLPAKNPEGMLLLNNRVFVCTWDTVVNTIYSIHINDKTDIDTIEIAGRAAQEILLDKNNKLWVLSGNVVKGKQAALTCIEPSSGAIIKSYLFPSNADPIRPVFNTSRDTLYFIEVNYNGGTDNNGIYRMPIADAQLPAQPFIAAQSFQYFWALGIDPSTGTIYVGDPKGFVQKGSVSTYNAQGNLLKQFKCGVGPGHFYFQ